jgi:hypothetical protein
MIMKKLDVIESVYEELGIPKRDFIRLVDSFFDITNDDLDRA